MPIRDFSVEEISTAYQDVDHRVIDAMSKVDVDGALVYLRQKYNLALDKLDSVRTNIDFVLIGLISARELNTEIKTHFPNDNAEIIKKLNEDIFKPILEYVRSHEPMAPVVEAPIPAVPTDPFESAKVEILKQENAEQITTSGNSLEELVIPIKPGFDVPVKTDVKESSVDIYREEI